MYFMRFYRYVLDTVFYYICSWFYYEEALCAGEIQ
jgi:hypothetical protein